ncbi:hypothetical protein F4859DRAFT_512683 [Xylaria cf. heliscus]|nr:hypothetical protein F4859DRAFT_512683 [Xylaria cf. heliscus]
MENSSDTVGSSPSWEESPPSLSSERVPKVRSRKVREWSQFELDTVFALICKYKHRKTPKRHFRRRVMNSKDADEDHILLFTTRLNEALNGADEYQCDIPVADVRELMDFLEKKNQTFMEYICRQPTPFRITRSKKYAFQRLCTDFNNAFYKWAIICQERRQIPSINTNEEISGLNSIGHYLSSPNQDSYLLGAARIQKILDAEISIPTERGWISNSVYAQRNREGPTTNSTSGSAEKASSHQRPVLPAKSSRRVHRRRGHYRMVPLVPPPPASPQPIQHEQINAQQYDSCNNEYHEGTGADMHSHPTSPTYNGHLDPTLPASPYPPTSPAYFNHAELRQSIHPTGPRPTTPMAMASPAYQYSSELQETMYPVDQQPNAPGSLTSPAHSCVSNSTFMGYQYPDPAQESRSFSYGSVIETPASPSSPVYIPNTVPTKMMHTTEMGTEEPGPYSSEFVEHSEFGLAPFDYGEYPLN